MNVNCLVFFESITADISGLVDMSEHDNLDNMTAAPPDEVTMMTGCFCLWTYSPTHHSQYPAINTYKLHRIKSQQCLGPLISMDQINFQFLSFCHITEVMIA